MIALNAAYLSLVDSHKTPEHVSRRTPSSKCRSCFVFARFSRRLVLTQGRLNYIQSEEIEVQPCFAVV
jgi:hypothetical protein